MTAAAPQSIQGRPRESGRRRPAAETAAPGESRATKKLRMQRLGRVVRYVPITSIVVLLPVLITAVYLFFIATPMYLAEARFVLRVADASAIGGSGVPSLLATGTGVANVFVDGYAVRDFIQSREAMERLDAKIGLQRLLSNADADPIVRMAPNASKDEVYATYRTNIQAKFNIVEQMIVLKIYAFSPDDAQIIARGLIELAEGFSDDLNRRARSDSLKLAELEVRRAEERASKARMAVAAWRNENNNIDPAIDVKTIAELINQLELQLLAAEAEVDQIVTSREPNSPRRASLEVRVKTIRRQIADTRKRMISGGATPAQLARYEELRIEQDFSDKNLDAAGQALQQARLSTLRQQKYISVVAEPIADRHRAYPNRVTWLTGALLVGLSLAFFGSIILGLVDDARRRR